MNKINWLWFSLIYFFLTSCKKGKGAICYDGSRIYSTGHGTCSWHGGIDYYVDPNETDFFKTVILVIVLIVAFLIFKGLRV